MKLLLNFPQPASTPFLRLRPIPWLFHVSMKRRNGAFNCKLQQEEDDHHFQAAMERASLRFQETLRPDPLFTDPYIRCLLPSDVQMDVNQDLHEHCIATKFIDEKLLSAIQETDGLRQMAWILDHIGLIGQCRLFYLIYLQTEYSEDRFRSLKFHVCDEAAIRNETSTCNETATCPILILLSYPNTILSRKQLDVGAKIPRRSLFFHVPSENSNIQLVLQSKGFNGARPSLWVFQGFPIMTLANFKDILDVVSSLAMKGCLFFGEMPSWLVETEIGIKSTAMQWIDKLFMSHGLRVKIIQYDKVARNLGKESTNGQNNILFVAEQLHFSDDQMEIWRREYQRIEEGGDEEGFEEL